MIAQSATVSGNIAFHAINDSSTLKLAAKCCLTEGCVYCCFTHCSTFSQSATVLPLKLMQASVAGCCLKVAAKEGEPATKQDEGLPEYVLRFHAPIVLHNLLPYPVTVTLTDARSNKTGGVAAQAGSWNIGVGGSEDVYFFDLTKKLKMGIEMQVSFCPPPPFPPLHPFPLLMLSALMIFWLAHPANLCRQAFCALQYVSDHFCALELCW